MTRILYFSSQFPTPAWPHMGMFSVQRIRALQDAGCDVIVICPVLITLPARFVFQPARLFQWVSQQIKIQPETTYQGLQVYYLKWFWFPKGLFGWYTSYFLFRQVRKRVTELVRVFKPDAILSSWLPDGIAASILGNTLGIPTISIADGSDVNRLPHSYPGWKYACRSINRKASTVIFVSQALKTKANSIGLYGEKNIVLHNAADIHLFHPGPIRPDQTIFSILAVGRLVPVKGFHILIAAFARLYQCLHQQSQLVLIGEGPLQLKLEKQAADLGVLQAVHFTGAVRHEEIVSYYQQADVFCLPSFSEGSPTVIVEAMACGLPVVASNVGGVGEIVNPSSGILVPPGDPERLSEALLNAKERVWNKNVIRQEVEDHYEWGRWAHEVIHLIQNSDAMSTEIEKFKEG